MRGVACSAFTMSLSPAEFLRRFLLHVLPTGFHRFRHYGLLAKGPRAPDFAALRALIAAQAGAPATPVERDAEAGGCQQTHPTKVRSG
jgi:hypothetical protein